jgi:uncharacterized protein YecE (DUF72 family)
MPDRKDFTKEERRARREAKRELQRATNLKRAAQMHTARLEAESTLEFSDLRSEESGSQQFYVGCSGWFYWHWKRIFYPEELPTSKWFEHYLDHFNTVELNAPFYSWPTVKTVQGWKRQLNRRNFSYTVKVCELITHLKRFTGTKTLIRDFGLIADLLGPRMGCFLFQLPPSYHYTPARLHSILEQVDPARRNVVEFRHVSWWDKKVFDAFRESKTIFCSCSGPRLPDSLVKTADDIYIRFHGVSKWYRHDYSKDELSKWAEKVKGCGADRVYAYFNNDFDGYAIKNAKSFARLLRS